MPKTKEEKVWECATKHKHDPCKEEKAGHLHGYECYHKKNISRSRGTGSFA